VETVLALIGLSACLAVWIGMALGPARRRRITAWPRTLWRQARMGRHARREAAQAIERARRRPVVDREGNVYRPRSLDRRDDRDKLH